LARRSAGHATPVARFGDLTVNLTSHAVTLAGRPVPLTATEARIVELLALRRGRTVTKEAMISYLYALSDAPTAKTIDVFICKIRRKIADLGGHGTYVATVWGRGYQLQDPGAIEHAA
jgi:two-component system, cell cycle response regulator CtrA